MIFIIFVIILEWLYGFYIPIYGYLSTSYAGHAKGALRTVDQDSDRLLLAGFAIAQTYLGTN